MPIIKISEIIAKTEEIIKRNPYRDERGRFASASGGSRGRGGSSGGKKSKSRWSAKKQNAAKEMDEIDTILETKGSGVLRGRYMTQNELNNRRFELDRQFQFNPRQKAPSQASRAKARRASVKRLKRLEREIYQQRFD